MAETLGSLCDKLTTVKLKRYHSDDAQRNASLDNQEQALISEMNKYLSEALSGNIPIDRLTFQANKVYKKIGNEFVDVDGTFGLVFAGLAQVNCELWHVQENVYDFEKVPIHEKDRLISQLAVLNLKRNSCIDNIDRIFAELIKKAKLD